MIGVIVYWAVVCTQAVPGVAESDNTQQDIEFDKAHQIVSPDIVVSHMAYSTVRQHAVGC